MQWQLQEAKNKFSQVVQYARKEPQIITLHSKEAVAIISIEDYHKLYPKKNKTSLLNVMQNSPWAKIELDISRSKDTGRDIEL
ncbi:MAG: antitoxin Phd [Methyloprofundus sp.]|nr:MAG: antitoxin Phd [Methyloprofundus sp.]